MPARATLPDGPALPENPYARHPAAATTLPSRPAGRLSLAQHEVLGNAGKVPESRRDATPALPENLRARHPASATTLPRPEICMA